ncbi:MAG: AEC family transporter [Magnetococcales bacterium]|nr:AEC family transporter [Magnetococcales bacterium]
MGNLILIILLLVSGMLLRNLSVFPKETPQALNQYVIHVSLPALILLRIPHLQMTSDLLTPVIMPWVMILFSVVAIHAVARHGEWSREVRGCLLLTVPLGNTSFLGIPMIEALFGQEWVPYGVLYDQLGSFLALSTYGALVVGFHQAGSNQTPTFMAIVRRIITFPAFIALVTALIGGGLMQAPIIQQILQRLADTLVPVVMVAVGFNLKPHLPKSFMIPLASGLGIKMIIAPAIALGLCATLHLTNPPAAIAIFEAGMPPMITACAMAAAEGLAGELAAAMAGMGIVLSLVFLPVLAWLLQEWLVLPLGHG